MGLSYKQKMDLSERLLVLMRLRLTGKEVEILPPEGQVTAVDPVMISLVGGLAPRPDPEDHREQPPCAMGMVLMIEPDDKGKVALSLKGRFDVTHRHIPDLATMRAQVQVSGGSEKDLQKLPDCFQRYTVQFADVRFTLDATELNVWSEYKLGPDFFALRTQWLQDPRLFRLCQVNDRGFVNLMVPWDKDGCANDDEFIARVAKALFIGTDTLEHEVVLRTRLRPPPPNFAGQGVRYLLEIYLQNNTETVTGRFAPGTTA